MLYILLHLVAMQWKSARCLLPCLRAGAGAPGEIAAIYEAASLGKCVVYSPPSITAFVPVSGSAGNVITVTGAGFLLTTNVSFNGQPAQFVVQSDSQLVAYLPSAATTGPIKVSGSTGAAATTEAP